MPTVLTRRRALRQTAGMGLALAFALAPAVSLAAQERIKLFKIITTKDDITIGVTETELRAMGIGEDVKILANQIVGTGQIVVWQYAVGRDGAGKLQMNPLRRIAILKNDTMRIEPASTTYTIAAPKS